MSRRQEAVLTFLRQNGKATVKRISDSLGENKRAVSFACESLSRWGDLEKVGHEWKLKGS
jgi:Mn-dependent DtxR family transcriptional regulator